MKTMKTNFTLSSKIQPAKTLLSVLFLVSMLFAKTEVNAQACSLVTSSFNLIANGSFESNTNNWSVTNGNIYTGSGYQVCGSQNGYLSSPNNGTPSWALTEVALQPENAKLNLSGYFGTHAAGQSCSPIVRIAYYKSDWTFISADTKNITTNVDVAPYKAGLYVINSKVPANTGHIRFEVRISCDYMKIDAVSMSASLALPVKLASFSAVLNNKKAELTWKTAEEVNVNYFMVEKSNDGINFTDAGMIFAFGNSNSEKAYNFSDNLATATEPVVYYRLRSVDNDGKTELSETRMLKLSKAQQAGLVITTYPNPVANELRITNPGTWQNKYEIFSLSGQVVSKTTVAAASQTETTNISKLQSGVYMVKATCNGEIASQKIVKQ
jgi:hypothetical protein